MAASLPSLDQMMDARAEDYLPDHQYQYQMYQFPTRSNGAQGEVALPQGDLSFQTLLDSIRAQADTPTPDIEHGGTLYEGHERVQSIPGVELDYGIPEATASRHASQEDFGDAHLGNDQQFELLTFPEGEDDAVTITANDLEGLQHTSFLGNNIIDFYVKYLERSLSPQERNRFYFFSSFFFTELLGSNSTATDINECEADFNQVRKWTGEVNLFEKDYIFIPILRSLHWSLIIICHLSTVTSSPDKGKVSPCILHLDPVEGMHESFEGQVRRYLYRAYRERYEASNEKDDMLEALACNTKYIRAQVPRQDNSYDCGVYVLHYVEVLISESISPDFSFASGEGCPQFTNPHFAQEVSTKREVIQNLIRELSNNKQEQATRPMDVEPKPQPRAPGVHSSRPQRPKRQNKPSLSKKGNEEETSVLLKASDRICGASSGNGKSRKRPKLDPSDGNGMLSSSPPCPTPPRFPSLLPELDKPSREQFAIPGFRTFDEDLRSTLLNLFQASSLEFWRKSNTSFCSDPRTFDLEVICQWLAIVQDQRPLMIRGFIFRLSELKLVSFGIEYGSSDDGMPCLKLSNLLFYRRFLEMVLRKNPDFDMYLQVCDDYDSVSFPKVPSVSLSLQRIRVLSLYECELECADLCNFPELRVLNIFRCKNLKSITGWEVVKDLGWLEIRYCDSYEDFPPVQCLLSLREVDLPVNRSSALQLNQVPDFRQCVRLRRLEIWGSDSSALNSVDLSNLRFLEVLNIWRCPALTTIQGLSGLHSLTELVLQGCEALRVPELGCLKALTRLSMWESGVEEIPGVQELHLLTELSLNGCSALKTLPWLGHLKALFRLGICETGVEEIPGVEYLVSLETLLCRGSRLKGLPDLRHLPRLREVDVEETPLTTTDPSSLHYGKPCLELTSHGKAERMLFVDEMSDNSDTEYNYSDQDSC